MESVPQPPAPVTDLPPVVVFRRACRSSLLPVRAQKVGQAIAERMNAQGYSRGISHADLGARTGYARRSVQRAVAELCQVGLLAQVMPSTGRGWLPRYAVIHSPPALRPGLLGRAPTNRRRAPNLPPRPYPVLVRTKKDLRAREANPLPGMFSPRVAPLVAEPEEPCPAPPGWFDEIRSVIGRRKVVAA